MSDPSNGYDALSDDFIRVRSQVGRDVVARWADSLPDGAAVIDIGAGDGAPVTRALVDAALQVWAVDASPRMVAAFQRNLPNVPVACETVERGRFFERHFDGAVAIGLMFLLPEDTQVHLIRRVADILVPGGQFLFTAPQDAVTWDDALTGQPSLSLGDGRYRALLADAGFDRVATCVDAGGNHYFAARNAGT
ncbi:MAG: class I SAM-dependent methyltransferase [Pseudomonadota bacterium]